LVDPDVLALRLAKLEQCVVGLRALAKTPKDTFVRDVALQAQGERWLHLAVESALDIAHHVLADRGGQPPPTYRDAFLQLERLGVLDAELAGRMADWAGLRNVLVHLDVAVDHARLHDIMAHDLDDLERFAAAVAKATDDGR